jgi:uncharacterized membrane protein YjgN (DUF898 family)
MDNKNYQRFSFNELLKTRQSLNSEVSTQEIADLEDMINAHPDNPANQISNNTTPVKRTVPVQFFGKTAEFFSIWIVNLLLTIVTLGIYSAWATVRNNRYFYSNTEIDGHRFAYLAEPLQILKGRIIGLLLFGSYFLAVSFSPFAAGIIILVLVFAYPLLICMSLRFKMRMTAYRNVRFNFSGKYGRALVVFILLPTMSVFTLYIALPWVLKKVDQFIYDNITFGDKKLSTSLETGEYFAAGLGAVFIGIVLFVLASFGLGLSFSDLVPGTEGIAFTLGYALFIVVYIAVILICSSFYTTRIRNHIFNNSVIENVSEFTSELSVSQLIWLRSSNFIAIVCSLGFAMPWVKIRTAKLYASVTQVTVLEGADSVLTNHSQSNSAIGEEVANAFDIDVAIG